MRSTFSRLNRLFYHREAASALLGISDAVLRECLSDNGAFIEQYSANIHKPETVKLFSLLDILKLAAWRRKQSELCQAANPLLVRRRFEFCHCATCAVRDGIFREATRKAPTKN